MTYALFIFFVGAQLFASPPPTLCGTGTRALASLDREAAEKSLRNPGWWPKKIRELDGMSRPTLYRYRDGTLVVRKLFGERNGLSVKDDPLNEVGAYMADKKLDLGVVPPCIGTKEGASQVYIEGRQGLGFDEIARIDPIGLKRIRFLRSVLIPVRDKIETVVDAQGKVWTFDFSRDHHLQNEADITVERVLSALPDWATYERIKAHERDGYRQFGLEMSALLRKWVSVVDPLLAERGRAALFPN